MEHITFEVPTYNGKRYAAQVGRGEKEEFGQPLVPIIMYPAEGVRIVLGTSDPNDLDKPNIQIERQPAGWAIFLHPVGGGDPSGHVYFHDDGRSFVQREEWIGATPLLRVLIPNEPIPGFSDSE